jgi:hypothetical protein
MTRLAVRAEVKPWLARRIWASDISTALASIAMEHARVFQPPTLIALRTGLRRMAASVKAHGPVRLVRFSDSEVRDRLPKCWA